MRIITISILIITSLLACDFKQKNFKFSVGEEIASINLTSNDVSLTYALQYTGSDNVYFTNSKLSSNIKVYRLNVNDFSFKKLLDIKSEFHFEAYAIDEVKSIIYIFTGEELRSYNFNNELINSIDFGYLKNGFLSNQNPIGFFPFIKNDLLYIEYFPSIVDTYQSKNFYREPVQAVHDLHKNYTVLLDINYPVEYQSKCFGYNFIPDRLIGNNEEHIFIFPYNDTAFIYDSDGSCIDKKYFGSPTREDYSYIPYDKISSIQREVFDQFYKDIPHYGFSTFLSFSEIYSRQLISYDSVKDRSSCTVLFYDSEWNYLGEVLLKGTISLFDSKEHGILKIQKNDNKLKIYETKLF